MPKINLSRTVHTGGKVFFKGEAFVSDADQVLIDAELKRLAEIEGEEPKTELRQLADLKVGEEKEETPEVPKKGSKSANK